MPETPRYQVTERLDAGGMAEVYRGVAQSAVGGIKKAVAIKRILPNLSKNKKFISMFLDEARVSMHLQHANIVAVFDIGMAESVYFIVMEYVDGANLKTIIESIRRQGKRLPLPQILYMMMEVCKGLQYAHEVIDPDSAQPLNIVHRDISPPNILVSRRGEVKLVDFGLAKATSQLETTDPGVVKGKFSYLSPEAASGKDVDRRADVFAVGILLYELLTGKRLFYGETDYQTVELVRQAKVPPIAPQNREVTPELEAIVRKALARDLNQRFQTASDLHESLAQFLFSQRLKVTSRDIEQLIASVVREKQKSMKLEKPANNIIDALISDEMTKFTSLDYLDGSPEEQPRVEQSTGNAPLDPGHFVDTRGWADEAGQSKSMPILRNGAGATGSQGGLRDREDISGLQDLLEPGNRNRGGTNASQKMRTLRSGNTGANNAFNDAPTRNGVRPVGGSNLAKIIVLVVALLVLAAGALVFVFKDQLFGDKAAAQPTAPPPVAAPAPAPVPEPAAAAPTPPASNPRDKTNTKPSKPK